MDLDLQGNGSANCAFRWKTNTLSDNGTFYTSPLAQIANPTALGTWSLTFVNDTNVTMRTPSGSSTNFSIDPNLAALFPNPIYVYFGIMPDATAQANKGQAIILSRARVQGSIDTIDDDFLSDTNGLDTANIWTIEAGGGQTQSVFILPPDANVKHIRRPGLHELVSCLLSHGATGDFVHGSSFRHCGFVWESESQFM